MKNEEINKKNEQNLKTNKINIEKGVNSEIYRKDEIYKENMYVIHEDIEKIKTSICKIKYSYESTRNFGTGFFVDYNFNKYLITNYHVLPEEIKNIEIEIWDKSIIKFNLSNRNIIYLKKPKDITIVSLKYKEIDKIDYLYFDNNYIIGYNDYKNNDVFAIGYPKGDRLASGGGKIKEIINGYEFYHNIPTFHGSSGSPIILYNTLKVIGIHKEVYRNRINVGIFIGEAIKVIQEKMSNNIRINICIKRNIDNNEPINNIIVKSGKKNNKIKLSKKRTSSVDLNIENDITKKYFKNEIKCVYDVIENQEMNLLYDFMDDINKYHWEDLKVLHNKAKNIINFENIDIYVNSKKIKFNCKYKSKETGLIFVTLKFKKLLTSTSFMFKKCLSLKSIDFSLFNSSEVTDMCSMFHSCESLRSIDLSSLCTNKVTDMSFMFTNCWRLNSLKFSSHFNTSNVIKMRCMFSFCSSLKSLDLSTFDTRNVAIMYGMFFGCDWLESIDLSSFDTTNVINTRWMFSFCRSLEKQNIKVGEKGTKIIDEFETKLITNIFKAIFN